MDRPTGQQFGRCTVERDAIGAHTVVTRMLGFEAMTAEHRDLLSNRCLGDGNARTSIDQTIFPFPTLHMILADALVRRNFATSGPADFAALPPLAYSERIAPATEAQLANMTERERVEQREADAAAAKWYVLERLGECVARQSPEGVRVLALLPVATPEERSQIAVLQPAIAACLPPGTTVRLSAADARGAAVLAYYRMARALPVSAPAPVEAQP